MFHNVTLGLTPYSILSSPLIGFNETLKACCGGGGGLYNFDTAIECGYPPSQVCVDPSSYISWDGVHFTEAANRWISKALFNGLYTIPSIIDASCISADGKKPM